MTDKIYDESIEYEMEVKIIRLLDGTDIIASVYHDQKEHYIAIFDPMEFFFTNNSSNDELVIRNYLPIKVMAYNYATISFDRIIFIEDASESFEEFYVNTIQGMKDTSLRDSSMTKEQVLKESVIESFKDWDVTGTTMQ